MKTSDFFIYEEDPIFPDGSPLVILNTTFLDQLRLRPQESADDIETGYALVQLAHEELLTFGTHGQHKQLNDEEISIVLRTLRALLKRLNVTFNPPFRDFQSFHDFWVKHGMGGTGGWAARRGCLSDLFDPIYIKLDQLEEDRIATDSIRGVDGQLKNLIFASTGPKPQIVLRDAISNVVEVTRNAEHCLFYDRPLSPADGLAWGQLVDWWRATMKADNVSDVEVARNLYSRLEASVKNNPAERIVFRTYCERYAGEDASSLPALLPQVFLHYDPLTRVQRGSQPSVLMRERMDFLLLFPRRVRVVIEVDGKQHYADGDTASPRLYAEMMAEDRRLRLRGYEVYRFGGFELAKSNAHAMLRAFFDELLSSMSHTGTPIE